MSRLIYYAATSMDMFIADQDGSVQWLDDFMAKQTDKEDFGYDKFYSNIETVLMGRTTYDQVLSFGIAYPYQGKKSYVYTRDIRYEGKDKDGNMLPDVEIITSDAVAHVKGVLDSAEKDVWLVGGGKLASDLLYAGLISEIQIFVFPLILGGGVPLFAEKPVGESSKIKSGIKDMDLFYSHCWSSGVQELHYAVL